MFLNDAIPVFVEGFEDLKECIIVEIISRTQVAQCLLDELLGFISVQNAVLVSVVLAPDLVDHLVDGLLLSVHLILIMSL